MRNAKIEDFYVDSKCTQLKKSFSVKYKELVFNDFDLDGWTFVGFKEVVETNIPSNMKYDVEPETYYVLDFYPIGERQHTICYFYDTDDKDESFRLRSNPFYDAEKFIGSKFSVGQRVYQIKVSEEFLDNFIKSSSYAYQSLKNVIKDVIENDKKYYNQNWYPIPFMLFDDGLKYDDPLKYENVLKATMKQHTNKEVKNGKIIQKEADSINKIFEKTITRRSNQLDLYYSLNKNKMSKEYKSLLTERKIEWRKEQESKKYKENKKAKKIAQTKPTEKDKA